MPALLRMLAMTAGVACLVAFAGCGGDGTTEGSLTFGNHAPEFTSPTTITVSEDTSGVFYTATATDSDGDSVVFSILGGEDAAEFRITTTGALSFVTPPDFENPTDFGNNNVYRVQLGAYDGFQRVSITLEVTVTDVQSTAYRVRRIGFGFAAPVLVAPWPEGTARVFVGELSGRIFLLNTADGSVGAQPFLDLRGQVSTNGERGLLGFATAPDYVTTGVFYVFVTDPVGTIEVRRYRVSTTNREIADPTTMEVILRQPHSRINHNGGWIGFGPDGFLHVGIGDGGGSGDPDNAGQNTNTLLGKILRIDVARDDFPSDPTRNYGIPATNPFAVAGGSPEVWATGLRNPFRASFDVLSGVMLIGDVGEDRIEEVNVIEPGIAGMNFGWSLREGTQTFKGADDPAFTPPAAEYLHGTGPLEGDSVIGGLVYRGPVDSLRGQYFFGDFVRGNLWSLPLTSLRDNRTVPSSEFTLRNGDLTPDAGGITNPVAFGTDLAGNMIVVDMDGELFIVEQAPPATPDRPIRASNASIAGRHFCYEAWNGRTARWRNGEMLLDGEGFTCVRKHYEALARRAAQQKQ